MPKTYNSVIGVDIGHHSLKAVRFQRRKEGIALTHYASVRPGSPRSIPDDLKNLFSALGATAKDCMVSYSSEEPLVRILEQPETPRDLLRAALQLNGPSLLNQNVKSFVLDCDMVPAHAVGKGPEPKRKYLVAGLPRTEVERVSASVAAAGATVRGIQLPSLCLFHAFELSQPEFFENELFCLLDIGESVSTVVAGFKKQLILTRSFSFGGSTIEDALQSAAAEGEAVLESLEQEDEVLMESARVSMKILSREVLSSTGFIEHQYEGQIRKIYVSGGFAKSQVLLRLMSEEVGLPCEAWSAVDRMTFDLSPAKQEAYQRDKIDLNVACGAAIHALSPSAIDLNLHHEIDTANALKRRDPLRFAAAAALLVLALVTCYYLMNLEYAAILSNQASAAEIKLQKLEAVSKVAAQKETELTAAIQLSKAMQSRVEERFYWAPVLDALATVSPPYIQITSLFGSSNGLHSKNCTVTLRGIAAGEVPRERADDYRKALMAQFSKLYRSVDVKFENGAVGLMESKSTAVLNGRELPTVQFAIEMHFQSGAIAPPEAPIKKIKAVNAYAER